MYDSRCDLYICSTICTTVGVICVVRLSSCTTTRVFPIAILPSTFVPCVIIATYWHLPVLIARGVRIALLPNTSVPSMVTASCCHLAALLLVVFL